MDINKALRKQEKSNRRFLLILGFIFLILPAVLAASGRTGIFFLAYLGVIELLILATIIINIGSNYISYSSDGYKLRLRFGRLTEELNILCEKVAMVHAEGSGPAMHITLLTASKFRSKRILPVDEQFLKQHSCLANRYYKLKKANPENNYFYIVVTKGGYHKYRLLDLMYRTCVHAQYTDEAVERIKEFRNS